MFLKRISSANKGRFLNYDKTSGKRRPWFLSVCLLITFSDTGLAVHIPDEILLKLTSADFGVREDAERALIGWAKADRTSRAKEIIGELDTTEDPEIRERCASALRSIAMIDYLKEGEGYLGIGIKEEPWPDQNGGGNKWAVRITHVVGGGAAFRAGLISGDLITGLQEKSWEHSGAAEALSSSIRQLQPGTSVAIRIFRKDVEMNLQVVLDRRPPPVANQAGLGAMDFEANDRAAKDLYFKKWMNDHRVAR